MGTIDVTSEWGNSTNRFNVDEKGEKTQEKGIKTMFMT